MYTTCGGFSIRDIHNLVAIILTQNLKAILKNILLYQKKLNMYHYYFEIHQHVYHIHIYEYLYIYFYEIVKPSDFFPSVKIKYDTSPQKVYQ